MWFNPIVIWLLRSPFHGLVSNGIMLVTLTGRKSGKTISTPVNYVRGDNTLWVISWRKRTWWRNLRGGAKVKLLLAGEVVEGYGQVIEEKDAVAKSLFDYFCKVPQYAKVSKIGLDAGGYPVLADCERAALEMVMVQIDRNRP